MLYSTEELWKHFQGLPEELKSLIFSEKLANDIASICEENSIKDGQMISSISNYVGYVLHGVLSPNNFQEIIEKEVKIKKELAQKIVKEITQVVFNPVRIYLNKLYKADPIKDKNIEKEQKKEKSTKPDSYRESIE